MTELFATHLVVPPVPAHLASLLPPAAVEATVGGVFGSAVLPIETWAVAGSGKKDTETYALLQRLGATDLVFRRYAVPGTKGYVLEVTVFPLTDEQATVAWVKDLSDQSARKKWTRLRRGKTGEHSEFTIVKASSGAVWRNYELQFAKGRYAYDVSGFSPFGKTTSVIEARVRKLAKRWFAALASP